ncbi:MAG: hypothetical protein ISS18_16500 [Bacteroidales bacterium]|nr:hypothetical protein [Bacteroidales bacterium]
MNYNVVVTDNFKKEVKRLQKKHPSIKSDVKHLIDILEKKPLSGTPLGKNCYKIRFTITSKGRGKRSGGRVITYVKYVVTTIFLISIYDKAEKETISEARMNQLIKEIIPK